MKEIFVQRKSRKVSASVIRDKIIFLQIFFPHAIAQEMSTVLYNPRFINMRALHSLIDHWNRYQGYRVHTVPDCMISDVAALPLKFGVGDHAYNEKKRFDEFYKETRIDFYMDETLSTYDDALHELQPHMVAYFVREMEFLLSGRKAHARLWAAIKPHFIDISEEEAEAMMRGSCIASTQYQAPAQALVLQDEDVRRSKRRCVLAQRQQQRRDATTITTATTLPITLEMLQQEGIAVGAVDKKTFAFVPLAKAKRCHFNAVQWKRQQVHARKQLHRAVLSYDFGAVQRISNVWHAESEDERRLDFDAVEWALRRLCKQLLPMAALKKEAARANSLAMIDTLFECFRSMRLCRSTRRFGGNVKCMCEHLSGIVTTLPDRFDIATHLLQIKCDCRAK